MYVIEPQRSTRSRWWANRTLGCIALALFVFEIVSVASAVTFGTDVRLPANQDGPHLSAVIGVSLLVVGPISILFALTGVIWDKRKGIAALALALAATLFCLMILTQHA